MKLTPEELFVEKPEEGKPPKYHWSGVLIMMVPNSTFEKGDETKELFQRFFHLLKPQKRLIINIFVASLLLTILGILGLFYFKVLIDDIL